MPHLPAVAHLSVGGVQCSCVCQETKEHNSYLTHFIDEALHLTHSRSILGQTCAAFSEIRLHWKVRNLQTCSKL
jgi:hypothetical protein